MSSRTVDRPTLRHLLDVVLTLDSDLNAFVLDRFPQTYRRFAGGLDRQAKVNLLLEREDATAVLRALVESEPEAVEHHFTRLQAASAQRDAMAAEWSVSESRPLQGAGATHAGGAQIWRWDFFITHSEADIARAVELYDLLIGYGHRPYVAARCLLPGDDWNVELPRAQRQARVTVVLLSSRAEPAYYQREEIAAAVVLASHEQGSHRVVPVHLDGSLDDVAGVPYGLRSKHGLKTVELGGMEGVAQKLDVLMRMSRRVELSK